MPKQSELLRRSLTGIFIIAFTVIPVIYSPWSLLAWLCIIHLVGMIEFLRLQHPTRIRDYFFSGILTLWLALAGWLAMRFVANYIALVMLPVILSSLVLVMMIRNPDVAAIKSYSLQVLAGAAYISLALWTGTMFMSDRYDYRLLLIPIFLIWTNDTGAYLVGSRLGKHKIAPAISPGKTIEGTVGGAILALGLAFILIRVWPGINPSYIWFLGLLTPLFSLAGDLWESTLKRVAQVKDSGNILPGHGGMLDRYDSFLFVLPLSALGYFIFVA